MLLNFSVILAVLGLAVLVVDRARKSAWADADVQVGSVLEIHLSAKEPYTLTSSPKILAIFASAGVFAASNYLFATMFLYSRTLKVLS